MKIMLLKNQTISLLEGHNDEIITDDIGVHIRYIAELEKETFSHPWDYESCLDTMHCDYNIGFTLWDKRDFCGYLMASVIQDETELLRIAVDKAFRGRGYGSALLGAYLAYVGESCENGLLEVRSGNTSAKKLYEKMGYKMIAIRKNYYSGPIEDGDIYQIQLKKENES